jgi:hypothetical protein
MGHAKQANLREKKCMNRTKIEIKKYLPVGWTSSGLISARLTF